MAGHRGHHIAGVESNTLPQDNSVEKKSRATQRKPGWEEENQTGPQRKARMGRHVAAQG